MTVPGRAKFDRMNPRIPVELVKPYYEAWAKSYTNPRTRLAYELHISFACAKALIEREDTFSMSEVDQLLTAFGRPDVWHTDLAEYYEDAA